MLVGFWGTSHWAGLDAQTIPKTRVPTARPEVMSSEPRYEVVSVKPSQAFTGEFMARFTRDGFTARNITPVMILRLAFDLENSNDDLFLGAPKWAYTDRFDIDAKVGEEDAERYAKLTRLERNVVLQSMLAERFQLLASRGVRQGRVYLLLPAPGGVKIEESKGAGDYVGPPMIAAQGHIAGHNARLKPLVSLLTQKFGRTVIDRTELAGRYDFALDWNPGDLGGTVGDGDRPSIQTALREQLGLTLEAGTGPVEVLTVQRLEHPAAN
ncbi:Protein of unknown function (DUF3738) [Terriglobus roseus DSM 18391]|uniref:Soil-associated protein, TIGR03435 family n=1 Tax=Terriglobus roseus (strain DSM 18391 / NRRL B-41598 / KBS 63) TaxID=926566 RepID=I3ZDR7_TERRK|nr:TIGR03435 family protein [Terriglobus roseus]AFL87385.1 Protein of unknown function (DUF3738) [Terriglobus roseus DSM 18391]